jgi:hypothetical protein
MSSAEQHKKAKAAVEKVDPSLTAAESQAVRAVASHETSYGTGWKDGEGAGSFNMGAIMTGETADACSGFKHGDSNPDEKFNGCFKVYPSESSGYRDLIRVLLKSNVRNAARKGDLLGIARAMFDNHYYTGTSHEPEVNIERYHDALRSNLDSIIAATGEKDAYTPKAPNKNLLRNLTIGVGLLALAYGAKKFLWDKPAKTRGVTEEVKL